MAEIKPGNKTDSEKLDAEVFKGITIWLIAIPVYLVFCTATQILFNIHLHLFDLMDDFQRSAGLTGRLLLPVIMFGLPAISIVVNVLSILEMYYLRNRRELRIRVKNKPLNILILLLSILVLGLYIIYLFANEH